MSVPLHTYRKWVQDMLVERVMVVETDVAGRSGLRPAGVILLKPETPTRKRQSKTQLYLSHRAKTARIYLGDSHRHAA